MAYSRVVGTSSCSAGFAYSHRSELGKVFYEYLNVMRFSISICSRKVPISVLCKVADKRRKNSSD